MIKIFFSKFSKFTIIIILFVSVALMLPNNMFDFWDFRTNLWGTAHLLVNFHNPYFIKQLYPDATAVWFPMFLGLLFPLGWLSLDLASRIWFTFTLFSTGFLFFLVFKSAKIAPLKLGTVLLAIFFFPPVIENISSGQISIQIVLCLFLASICLEADAYVWTGFFCALALTKPQLCLLLLPGLFLATFRNKGKSGLLKLSAAFAGWFCLLLVPLFAGFPGWVPQFISNLEGNTGWAVPSLFYFFSQLWGTSLGIIAWASMALIVFIVNIWIWLKFPPRKAVVWSMAITCLVPPYTWSWDFVLLLPCLLYLLNKYQGGVRFYLLLTGFVTGSLLIWHARWGTQISDQVFVWVPIYFITIYLLVENIHRIKPFWKTDQRNLPSKGN